MRTEAEIIAKMRKAWELVRNDRASKRLTYEEGIMDALRWAADYNDPPEPLYDDDRSASVHSHPV